MFFEQFVPQGDTAQGLESATDLVMTLTLIAARFQGFLYLSPFFNRMAMMRIVRLGFVLALTIILFPETFAAVQRTQNLQGLFLILVLKEFFLGMLLGMVVWMPVRGLELAGVILDTQRGSMQGQSPDAVLQGQTTASAVFLLQMFSGFFFSSGGFLVVLYTLFKSTEIWPITSPLPNIDERTIFLLLELAGTLLFIAVVFALPISGLMVLADVVISFIARSAPTLNALTFGMPVKSFILTVMLFFYMSTAYPMLMQELYQALSRLEDVLQ